MVSGESKRSVAASEGISRATLRKMLAFETPPGYCSRNSLMPDAIPLPSRQIQNRSKAADAKRRWMQWLYGLERGESTGEAAKPALVALTSKLSMPPNDPRKKILTVLAHARGFSANAIAEHLNVSRNSVRTPRQQVIIEGCLVGGIEPHRNRDVRCQAGVKAHLPAVVAGVAGLAARQDQGHGDFVV